MPSGPTHSAVAALAYAGLAYHLGTPLEDAAPGVILASLAGLAPDLDRPGSAASRSLWPLTYPLSLILFRLCGHRGFFHSIALACAVSIAGYALLPPFPAGALALGWWSHILLDSVSRRGVPLAWR
jgi:membrane-bound metal-dependent hydrolase YbcI (DUF457 family)